MANELLLLDEEMNKNPEVSVKLVVRVRDHVLMLRRASGSYIFPGGHLEWGERTLDCLKRESKEELSYALNTDPEFFDLYEHIMPDGSQHILVLHYLLVLISKPQLKLADDEAESKIMWLTREELAKIVPRSAFVAKVFGDHE